MATTALDEIDIGGHSDALTVETKQAEAPAKPASKVPLTIAAKPSALPRAAEDCAATSHAVNSERPSGEAASRFAEAGKTIVDEHPRSDEQVLDPAKALVALVRLLARLAAREAWDDGRPGATIRPTTRPRSSASHRRCSHEDQGSLIAAQARLP